MLLPAAAGIGRRLELADQPDLLECGLELRAQDAPLDAVERQQRRLDRGPLALTSEVGAKTGAQVAGATDVEHLLVAVSKEVDAGPSGRAAGEGPLVVDPALARRRESAELGEPPGAELLRQPDQVHQHLGCRLGIGQSSVAGPGRDAEEFGERGEPDAASAALEQPTGERCRAERGLGQAPAVSEEQLPLEEALVESCVVRDEQVIAGEGEEAPENRRDGRCAASAPARAGRSVAPPVPGASHQDSPATGSTSTGSSARTRTAPISQMRSRAAESPVVSRSKTTNSASSSRGSTRVPARETMAPAATTPAVAGGHLGQQRAGESLGDRGCREQRAGRLDRRQRAALLQRIHQAIECVEGELHSEIKANICSLGKVSPASRARLWPPPPALAWPSSAPGRRSGSWPRAARR